MPASPFDHPLFSGLLGDEDIEAQFSVEAELRAMLDIEIALAEAEAAEGIVPAEAGETIAARLGDFKPDMAGLRRGVANDGIAVPELVKQLRAAVGSQNAQYVHFGATSQDVVDTSLALRLARVLDIFAARLDAVVKAMADLEARDGKIEVMAHTRMQAAIPVPAARKIRSWREPLERHRARLDVVRDGIAILHFGGAAGTLDKLAERGIGVAARVADRLGLRAIDHPRHSERDGQVELANWLSLVTGSLGKMGQDIALAAQSEVGEVRLTSAGGSSAMPHKQNPVGAEVLVTLARFNATLVSGMHHALVHENERSGAAWTLEWMILPQMVMATGAALRIAKDLVNGLSFAK